jgi:hypothetical protein
VGKSKKIGVFFEIKKQNTMPGAAISENNRGNCGTWRSNVGSRRLPCSELEYKARAPEKQASNGKNGIFKTVWLPVNASNRVVNDRQQDIMHMKYSGQLEKAISRKDKHNSYLSGASLPVTYELTRRPLPKIELEPKQVETPENVKLAMWKTDHNSLAPFASLGKPTCGFFFTRNISHNKRLIGINATNTVKWRSIPDMGGVKKM